MRSQRGEQPGPAVRSAHELHELHRRQDELEALPKAQLSRVGGVDRQLEARRRGAGGQLTRELRVQVHGGDPVPAAGQVECNAAGARAQVEHPACLPAGKLAPKR